MKRQKLRLKPQKKVWTSQCSVILRTFYRQILSWLYSSFFFWNFRHRLARVLVWYKYVKILVLICHVFFFLNLYSLGKSGLQLPPFPRREEEAWEASKVAQQRAEQQRLKAEAWEVSAFFGGRKCEGMWRCKKHWRILSKVDIGWLMLIVVKNSRVE